MIESSGCLGNPNYFRTHAYLMPIVRDSIDNELVLKHKPMRPPERDPSYKPNLLSAFGIEDLYLRIYKKKNN